MAIVSEEIEMTGWLEKVREKRPLVHNITNLVVTNIAANALLAIGASPVMAYAKEEVADMAKIASALSLNMGTLDDRIVESMLLAGKSANEAGVPVIFDPVGVGATPYRNQTADEVVNQLKLTVLRGNGGEIGALLRAGGTVKGVDAGEISPNLKSAIVDFAKTRKTVVVVTGQEDYITDGDRLLILRNGHPLLAAITGSGCMLTALLGAFIGAVDKNAPLSTYADAAAACLTCYNVAGEIAAVNANGPGTFQAALFDALFNLSGDEVASRAKIELA
jgi:hydroxyethylthiazole kinase